MDIDQETLGIPDTDYDAQVTMASAEFSRLCRDLTSLGESVKIEVSKEGVRFSSEGDAANGSVLLKPNDSRVRTIGESSNKKKVKQEDEDKMDEDASEDDGGKEDDEEEEEGEESSNKKRKRSAASSKKTKVKSKKAKTADDDDEDEGSENGVTIAMNQQVNLSFSLKYLANFSKSSTLCNRVSMSMSNEVPLMVAYDFGQGTVHYFLAPKIGDD